MCQFSDIVSDNSRQYVLSNELMVCRLFQFPIAVSDVNDVRIKLYCFPRGKTFVLLFSRTFSSFLLYTQRFSFSSFFFHPSHARNRKAHETNE